jgi:hypothetical protein
VKTPHKQLASFLAHPPTEFSSCCVQLSIRLARLMRWMESAVPTPAQKNLFLLDFPQHTESLQTLELRLAQLRQDLKNAIYAALIAKSVGELRRLLQQTPLLLDACQLAEDDIQILLQSGYKLDLEISDLGSSSKHAAVTRVIAPTL